MNSILDPMDYFLLNDKTGELRTAKPLDKEALEDATGLIVVIVRVSIHRSVKGFETSFIYNLIQARELVNGVPVNDESTISTTQASITIRDVNDSPPTFNQNNYFVSLSENTAVGTPLPVEITVTDPDVVGVDIASNSITELHPIFFLFLVLGSKRNIYVTFGRRFRCVRCRAEISNGIVTS